MSILFSHEILDSIKKELKNATESVQIITAYCKESTFKNLHNCINQEVIQRRLLVRFRMDDVIKNSSDLSALKFALANGWKVYIRFDLHAKTYIVDNKRGLIGSANATNSGMSLGSNANMEMATLVDIDMKDITRINRLFEDAICLNDALLESLENQLANINIKNTNEKHTWDKTITSLFHPKIDTLFSHEFPENSHIEKGEYIQFLDTVFDGDVSKIKEALRWSNPYLWLLKILDDNGGCLFFGALTEKLHNSLINDPKPYRKDVKQMLSALLEIITTLEMEEVVIDRPNYSQRVRLSDKSF